MQAHILFGFPMYDGRCGHEFASAYAKTVALLQSVGIGASEAKKVGCCYVDQARDEIIHMFLTRYKDCTHLLFIDSDIAWEPKDVLTLLGKDKDVVCGVYCLKSETPQFTMLRDGPYFTVDDGMFEAIGVPAGFMLWKREALQKMVDHYTDLQYAPYKGQFEGETLTALCQMYIDQSEKKYYREDIALCKRWHALGGKLHVSLEVTLGHYNGCKRYDFQLRDFLRVGSGVRKQDGKDDPHRGPDVPEPDPAGHQP